ncbi:MAG: hypothetical protein ACK4TA_22600 [Saprospiraceae bacterium]
MDAKNVIGIMLVILGIICLIPGVLAAFEGGEVVGISPWALIIIGGVLFAAGISVVRSIRPPYTSNTINKVD